MKTETTNYIDEATRTTLNPRYVLALSFDDDNTDITYITSHADCIDPGGVAAIDRIDGALQPDGISGQTQRIAPENAQHTIGSVSFKILDVAGKLTTKINTKLTGGEGLRHKRIRLYKGFEGLTSWDDYALRLTYRVEDVQYMDGVYTLSTGDIQRQAKTKIFEPHQGVLTSTLTASATTVPITIANAQDKFPLVYHDAKWDAHINQAVGYIQIDDEIIAHSGWTDATYTALTVVERGALGTVAVEHEVTATEEDQKKKVDEYIYLQMQSPRMAYALLTGLDVCADNALTDPFDLTTASWGIGGGSTTIEASANAAPVAWGAAWTVTDDNPSSWESVFQANSASYVSGAVWTASILIREDATHSGQVALRLLFDGDGGNDFADIRLTLSTGTVTAAPGGACTIDSSASELINGWWYLRVSAHYTGAGSTTQARLIFFPAYTGAVSVDSADVFAPFLGPGEVTGWIPLPSHWHLGIHADYTRLADFTGIGADLWDTTNNTGRVARFMGLDGDTGKAFIEKELLLWMGAYMPVHADGTLGLRRLKSVLPYAGYDAYLDSTQIIRYGALRYDQQAVINDISIDWNWIDSLDRYTKTTRLFDSNSISKHGTAAQKTYEFRGVFNGVHTESDLENYFQMMADRWAAPPLRLQIDVMPQWDKIEVGDTVRVDLSQHVDYHIDDTLSRTFEVQQVRTDWITGKVSLTLFGGTEASALSLHGGFKLADAFYGSGGSLGGTDLASVLTISAGAITANGSLTGGDYYYDGGDLTLNSGVTVTISGTVRLRVKGFFTVNGTIDGTGGGAAGGAGGSGFVFNSPGSVPAYNTAPASGTPGVFGNTSIQPGLNFFGFSSTSDPDYYAISTINLQWQIYGFHKRNIVGQKTELEFQNITNPDGLELRGLPIDLIGTGGGGGDQLIELRSGTQKAAGGDGGAGGGGLILITRGLAFGASGSIDLSGGAGDPATSAVIDGRTIYAAGGAGGYPGACLVLIDGDSATPDRTKFITNTGSIDIPAVDVLITPSPGAPRVDIGQQISSGQSAAYNFFITNRSSEHKDGLVRIQYIPRALNGFTWYPAQEAREVTGYENKPPEWDQIADSAGLKPANNATVNNIYRVAAASPPSTPVSGDVWYQTDTGKLQTYDGAAWQPAATQNLVTRAGSAPSTPQVGDLWFNTTSGAMQSYDGATWQPVATQNLVTRAGSAPSTPQVGDLWFNTTSGAMQSYDGSVWQPVATQNLVTRAGSAPSSPQVGDLWFNTTSGAMQSYDGATWQPVATQNLVTRAGSAPSSPQVGDLWIDTSGGASTEVTQVYDGSTWQDMATNGATAGTNLRDAALNLIGDADVLNSYNVLDSAITVTVGTGGDYATINAALVGLTQKFPTYASTAARATINLLTGTQITEQVIVDGIDLSWVTITSVDATVTENITLYTGISNANGLLFYPIIAAINGGKSPILKLKISTALASGRYCGLFVTGAGSSAEFHRGSAYGFDCTMVTPSTTNYGIYCETLGRVSGVLTSITNFGFNVYVDRGAEVQVESGNFDGAHFAGIWASNGGRFTGRGGSVDNSQYSVGAVVAYDGAHIDVYGMTVDNPTGDAFHCVGSMMQARGCTGTTIPAGKYAFNVGGGGIITASLSTASLSQTANIITSSGLIIQ